MSRAERRRVTSRPPAGRATSTVGVHVDFFFFGDLVSDWSDRKCGLWWSGWGRMRSVSGLDGVLWWREGSLRSSGLAKFFFTNGSGERRGCEV